MSCYGGMSVTVEKLILATPRGFCAGVDRAIDVVKIALELYDEQVYVRKEIVHNRHVVDELRKKGAIFVDDLDEVPDGALVIYSAHGVSPEVRAQAAAKQLKVIDATCPLVTKVHNEAIKFAQEGRSIILVGHKGHDEVIGTTGEALDAITVIGSVEQLEELNVPDPTKVAVITQTTLSLDDTRGIIDALKHKFPALAAPPKDDICYATQNRQTALKELASRVDLILALGSQNSSNSKRLIEVAKGVGVQAYLIDDVSEINPAWLKGTRVIGVTAGASAPEHLVQGVVSYFKELGVTNIEEIEPIKEEVNFGLPQELIMERQACGRS
ncbi:MAG: 4-hydroxy-3-methylbut-2-enyl diphosphate reductase [Candidatus Methylomirabilis sp.]|nr:4-hydroxy-3-methylbut-2-enyl diphosphate reductase [Candidatus Methylomirabilis sp.]